MILEQTCFNLFQNIFSTLFIFTVVLQHGFRTFHPAVDADCVAKKQALDTGGFLPPSLSSLSSLSLVLIFSLFLRILLELFFIS